MSQKAQGLGYVNVFCTSQPLEFMFVTEPSLLRLGANQLRTVDL